ncbi:MAG: VWA domain-containing protein [Dehalococcoidia bacterium]
MDFARPAALLLAAIGLPLAFVVLRRRGRGLALPAAGAPGLAAATVRLRLARVLPLLRPLVIVLLAVAVAGPRIGDANAIVRAEGIDIALSLDISSSMTASNLGAEKTRFDAAKDVIRDFIKGEKDDRIGFVVFARDALAVSPPTLDYAALDEIVKDTETGIMPDGTGIGVGLATALIMLRDSTAATRIVILLTDGEHNTTSITPEEAADLATSLKIKVYTIGLVDGPRGSASGVDDERLTNIAERTGGRYFSAGDPESLAEVYREIGRLEKSGVGRDRFEQFTELVPWFAVPAALILLLELVLGATWLRRAGR